ncbi:tubulin-like doman-containing protein [Micromonospora sp. DT233]|uniref:tubulin-like doman-containing protein n=1 Tax=Micromonospora sp. DT233 TaxID=3393432 RepID=UPI003CFAF977
MEDSVLPALVIGLGGTGSAAAAHLKYRLATEQRWQDLRHDPGAPERAEGHVHDWPVLLRALDVDRRTRPRVDGMSLDVDTEDLYLDGSIGSMINKIRQGREVAEQFYPTVVPWFGPQDARQIRDDEALSFLVEGAGQIRSFGRLSFFSDVLGATPVMKRLEDALDQLIQKNADSTPNIYVVSSTAGGTGAGILLDVLAYLQQLRQAQDAKFSVTLFCVLSGAFRRSLEGPQRARSEANGYALLRELDRLMYADRAHPAEFRWSPRNRHEMTAAPVQYVYLVDGRRSRSAGRQLPAFDAGTVCPVAVADAVYAHLLPTVGPAFSSYRVNARPYTHGSSDLYSTFGVYLVEYAWEPLIRGLVNRVAADVLAGLPRTFTDLGPEVDQFLGGATDMPEAEGAQPPPVLQELDSDSAREGLLTPTSTWLTTAGGGPRLPELPNLHLPFEDIGAMRTEHRGQVVVDATQETVRLFWGEENVPLTLRTQQQWHPVADHHARRSDHQWGLALRGAVARIMSRRDGGPRGGLAFLGQVQQRLDVFRDRVENAQRADPGSAKAVRDREEQRVREDKGLFRGRHQLTYLAAEQSLLTARHQQDCQRRTLLMLERMTQTVALVRKETQAWADAVDDAGRVVRLAMEDVQKERRQAERFPLRRVLPPVDDRDTEEWLYDRSVGAADSSGRRPRLDAVGAALTWRVALVGEVPTLGLVAGAGPGAPAGPVDAVVGALRDAARPLVAPLRQMSVFELLERRGEAGDELGRELLDGSAWLVSYDDEEHRRLVNLSRTDDDETQQQVYAFAALPSTDAPGAGLSRELWKFLRQQRVNLNDIVPSNEAEERPATDKIVLFASRHSLRLAAFDGFNDLRRSYEERRDTPPSPHVITEEKNAAVLEARSEELVGEGVLARPLGRVTGGMLLLCRDADLLHAAAVALANERLAPVFAEDGGDQVLGWHTRSHRGGQSQQVGEEAQLRLILRDLVTGRTRLAEVRRAAVLAAADEAVRDLDWEYGTRRFYGLPPTYRIEPELWHLLTVAAHVAIDRRS